MKEFSWVSETLEDDWYEEEVGDSLCGNHVEEDIGVKTVETNALVVEKGGKRMGVDFEHLGGCVKNW